MKSLSHRCRVFSQIPRSPDRALLGSPTYAAPGSTARLAPYGLDQNVYSRHRERRFDFRRLQGKSLIAEVMSQLLDVPIQGEPQCIYWSYSTLTNGAYQPLQAARKALGEREGRSTEPDLMIEADDYLILDEAKVTANNRTTPSSSTTLGNYQTGGSGWFQKVFTEGETAQSIATELRLYELMRMWLIGTWMAERQLGKRFILVNLVLGGRKLDVEERFISRVGSAHGKFMRRTWEEIGKGLPQEDSLRDYFQHKTRGYSNGKLKHMFKME